MLAHFWVNYRNEIETIIIILQEEGGEGGDGDKKEIKKPTGTPLFDDEIEDSKANVKEKAEELRKQGC